MPLYKTINFNSTTQILIWEITESSEQLSAEVLLNEKNCIRLSGMKSELHQRGFLSVRKLLQTLGYTDFDLYYDPFGKPHLKDGKHISITHSHGFAAIIISDVIVGIDIELQREKIIRIADKFTNSECSFLEPNKIQEYIRKLTVIWGVKEAVFKIRNEQGISFKDHIKVAPFSLDKNQTLATLHFNGLIKDFDVHYKEIESGNFDQAFTLVYAFEK